MESFCLSVSGRLDLIFFVYGLSFSAMGLLLFLQPRKESSFALSDSLWLLGWFGLVHGLNEFMDMWGIIHPAPKQWLSDAGLMVLAASYLLLLEFGRRSVKALCGEVPALCAKIPWLYGRALTPALFVLALALSALSGDMLKSLPSLSRLLLGFPGALLAGLAFLGYALYRKDTLVRLKARKYFLLAGTAFLAYSALGGLVLPKGTFFPANFLNTEAFMAAFGLPVQLFRAACAAAIFGGIMGTMRIFREGALRAAQQELLDIIEFFPDATFVIDKNRKVIAWNRALEKLTGVPKADMLGKGDYAYSVPFYGEPRPILIDLIGAAHPEEEKFYEYVTKRADGAIYAEVFVPSLNNGAGAHVWVTASPLQDNEGNVYGAIESVRDVTDRKLAEQALQRSEAQYRALIETTNTGFLIIDKNGRVLDANQEYVRLTGHQKLDEILGRSVLDWTAPYEKGKNARAIENCAKNGHIRNLEIDYTDKRGAITPIELNATVVDMGGEPRILTLCRDISERKRSQDALQESEERYRTLVNNAQVGIVVHQAGVMKFVNKKMAEIVRVARPEDVIGRNVLEFMHPDFREFVKERMQKSRGGRRRPSPGRGKTGGGRRRRA